MSMPATTIGSRQFISAVKRASVGNRRLGRDVAARAEVLGQHALHEFVEVEAGNCRSWPALSAGLTRAQAGLNRGRMDRTEANTGTREVSERLRFDVAALERWMARSCRGLRRATDRQPVQGRPVQPDLPARHAVRPRLRAAPQAARQAAARRPCGRPRSPGDERAWAARLSGAARPRPVRGRERHRHALLRHGPGRRADRLGSRAFPGLTPNRTRRPFRRDERDHRPAAQLRSGGDRPRRLWPRDRLRRAAGRALVEAI